jgi:Mg2+ and Co2+ transporter CorA
MLALPMSTQDPDTKEFVAFLRIALVPMLITKAFILYFGINYSLYPGEGYGYGLAFFCAFTVISALIFIWRQTRPKRS